MSQALGTCHGTIRDITSTCDWCGDECSGAQSLCMAVSCQRCDTKVYHQVCLEKFLKKQGLKTSRLSGFPCPFGKGKGSSVECKGKIEKSHPIVPKNEEKKKARMAPAILEAVAKQPRAPNNNANIAAKAAPPKLPAARKMAPPKLHNLQSVARTHTTPGVSTGAWGLKGAAPVLANAHLPPPEDPEPTTAAAADGPRPAQLPVGLVLEEALTKAQKKNLARKKKRAATTGAEAASEASSDHQDNITALGASDSAGSSSCSRDATGAGLLGFDGAPMANNQHDLWAQQGIKFITDPAQYNQLLGIYCADSDDDDTGDKTEVNYAITEDITGVEADLHGVAAVDDSQLAGFNSGVIPAPAPVTFTAPVDAAAPAAALADLDKDATEMQALNAAMAASIKQYQLEEEMRHQREVLTSGFGAAGAFNKAHPAGYAPYPTALLDAPTPVPMPIAAPVVAPIAVAAPAAPSMFLNQIKRQPQVVPAGSGHGWVFGGGNQGAGALPPHIVSGYAAPAAGNALYEGFDAGNIVGSMAAGHSAPEAAAGDDEDDLDTLLALCGVAG